MVIEMVRIIFTTTLGKNLYILFAKVSIRLSAKHSYRISIVASSIPVVTTSLVIFTASRYSPITAFLRLLINSFQKILRRKNDLDSLNKYR